MSIPISWRPLVIIWYRYGSELGPVQGVGYINELLARLTDHPVEDHTQTNQTLDSNSETFPLGRGIYVDFSHDNLMTAVASAMGLFRDKNFISGRVLDPTRRDDSRDWFISRIVPFSGRMVVERIDCGSPSSGQGISRRTIFPWAERRVKNEDRAVFVRVLMNDAVQKLDFCEGVDEDGLCPLPSFVKSQSYAKENGQGDWEKCFQ